MVMFSIISMDFFQLEAAQAGYLTSYFGVLQMVSRGLHTGHLWGGERRGSQTEGTLGLDGLDFPVAILIPLPAIRILCTAGLHPPAPQHTHTLSLPCPVCDLSSKHGLTLRPPHGTFQVTTRVPGSLV
jgi:hypothetical protein